MDREVGEGINLGTMLTFIAATLTLGVLIFWYARLYSNQYFERAAAQNQAVSTLELDSISTSGILDVPLASVYNIVSREWRAVHEVAVFDKNGVLITKGEAKGLYWELSNSLTKADGGTVTKLTAPEQVLYATAGMVYSDKISGRAFVSVTQSDVTKTYAIQVKLQQ